MKVSRLLDSIEREVTNHLTKKSKVGRFGLLDILERELEILAHTTAFATLSKYADVATTQANLDRYALPDDFPSNFLPASDEYTIRDEDHFLCYCDTGSRRELVNYMTPGRFYTKHNPYGSPGVPDDYTIQATDTGQKQIVLGPVPDSAYTIGGLYKPDQWNLTDEDQVSGISEPVLIFAVARNIDPENGYFAQRYNELINTAYLESAQTRKVRAYPAVEYSGRGWSRY